MSQEMLEGSGEASAAGGVVCIQGTRGPWRSMAVRGVGRRSGK